jgi:hypothetical protein
MSPIWTEWSGYPRAMVQSGPAEYAAHHSDHHHGDVSGGWLRAAVFGAMDGLVTNIALVSGVGGGGADREMIILTGMAGLVAGAFSMALGEFASVGTQNDAWRTRWPSSGRRSAGTRGWSRPSWPTCTSRWG